MVARVRTVPYGPGLDALERHVRDTVVQPVTEAVAEDMRRYVPVLTGDLRGTIRTEYPTALEGRVYFGDVDEGVDYHLYQEYGTSQMAAQPYARPALFKTRTVG
jgi:hypothetical protein